jgi:hypothetical protein
LGCRFLNARFAFLYLPLARIINAEHINITPTELLCISVRTFTQRESFFSLNTCPINKCLKLKLQWELQFCCFVWLWILVDRGCLRTASWNKYADEIRPTTLMPGNRALNFFESRLQNKYVYKGNSALTHFVSTSRT